jgi:Ca2+-binding EF-hand superfamily protein
LSLSGAKSWASLQKISIFQYDDLRLSDADKEMIGKDVESGRSDPNTFNWEIHETLLRLYKESYISDIKRVLQAYCIRNSKVGYCQGMNIVTVWLLMFMDQNSAFIMLSYLVEKWLLPDFYMGSSHGNSLNGFYIESTVIASIVEHLIPSMKTSEISSSDFSDLFSLQHLIQLFVSTVDLQTTVFLWDKLAEHGSIALIRGVVSLVIISEKAVNNGTHPLQILKLLNENRIAPQVKETYGLIMKDVTDLRVEKLRKMATDLRAKQWMDCERIVVKKLANVSKFSNEEVEKLQERFVKLMKEMQGTKKDVNQRRPTIGLPVNLQIKMEGISENSQIGIGKNDFLKLLQEIAPGMADQGEELFRTFDEDHSGYLDFRELMCAMSYISKGNFEDKLRVCFDAYDSDRSGFLKDEELQVLIERILAPCSDEVTKNPHDQDLKIKIVQIHQKMSQLTQQNNGKISFSDFLNGIKADMFLYNCVSEYLGTEHRPQVSKIYSAMNFGTFSEPNENNGRCKMCLLL